MIKSDSFPRTSQIFCRVCIAFVFLVFSPTVSFATDSCKADVVFLMDNTGSMRAMINSTRSNAVNILNKISGGDPRFAGIDVQFGTATFWGDPIEYIPSSWKNGSVKRVSQMTDSELTAYHAALRSAGRKAYKVNQQLTSNKAVVRASMNEWKPCSSPGGCGGDWPEANYFGLHQLATEGGRTDMYPACGGNWAAGSYAADDCIKDGADHYTAVRTHQSDVEWLPTAHSAGSFVVRNVGSVSTIFVARRDLMPGSGPPDENPASWESLGPRQPRSNPALWTIVNPRPPVETRPEDWRGRIMGHHQGDVGYYTCGTGPDFSDYQGWSVDAERRKASCTHAMGWRDDAGKVIVTFGDAISHIWTVDHTEVLKALQEKDIVVASINTQPENRGFDEKGLTVWFWGWHTMVSKRDQGEPYGLTGTPGQSSTISLHTGGTAHHKIGGSEATVKAILDAVSAGIGQAGSAAPVSFDQPDVTADTIVFVPKFDSKKWSGDLEAWNLNPATGAFSTQLWSAASKLKTQTPTSRNLLTYRSGSDGGGIRFEWSQLSTAQQNDLKTNSGGVLGSISDGQARIAYLRGDRSNEGSGDDDYRVRQSRMGDVWHSRPKYVGSPPKGTWPSEVGKPYADFQRRQQGRTGMVYVGSNGGMLHGFDAATGVEKMAYLPAALFSSAVGKGYHALTDPDYGHSPLYVDETPTLSDAQIGPGGDWRTLLVGGLGRGGRGVFALDVTEPDEVARKSKASQTVLWEFNKDDDAHLGFTYGQPVITYLNNKKWAAIFGNGIDGSGSDGTGGKAQLFIVYLDGPGADGVWDLDIDYHRITTSEGSTIERNGLFAPKVVDADGNGTTDLVYAGDLFGNLWRFDLSGSRFIDWPPPDRPLFAGSKTRPITSPPLITSTPKLVSELVGEGGRMVFFGTGRFLVDGDKTDIGKQHYYGVFDPSTPKHSDGASVHVDITDLGLSNLVKQKFLSAGVVGGVVTDPDLVVTYSSARLVTPMRKFGWYIELPISGERIVAHSLARQGHVIFNSIVPDRSACSSSGEGVEYTVRMFNGGAPLAPQFDLNDDGRIDLLDGTIVDGRTVGYSGVVVEGKGLLSAPATAGDYKWTSSTGVKKTKDMVPKKLPGASAESGRISWGELTRRLTPEAATPSGTPEPPGTPPVISVVPAP